MGDPLSVVAGIIAIVGGVRAVVEGLGRLQGQDEESRLLDTLHTRLLQWERELPILQARSTNLRDSATETLVSNDLQCCSQYLQKLDKDVRALVDRRRKVIGRLVSPPLNGVRDTITFIDTMMARVRQYTSSIQPTRSDSVSSGSTLGPISPAPSDDTARYTTYLRTTIQRFSSETRRLGSLPQAVVDQYCAVITQAINYGADVIFLENGWMAVHLAAQIGSRSIVKILLRRNVGAASVPIEYNGQTALHVAALRDAHRVGRMLIQQYHVDPNIQDSNKYTAQDLARYHNKERFLTMMAELEYGNG